MTKRSFVVPCNHNDEQPEEVEKSSKQSVSLREKVNQLNFDIQKLINQEESEIKELDVREAEILKIEEYDKK